MSFINVASTITGQCRSSANTHKSLLALRNSGQISSNDYNSAKTTNTTAFTAIQSRVTAAATAIAAQNAATANSNIALITTQQASVIADPTLKVYLLAPEYSGSGAWLDKSGNGKNATLQVGTATKSAAGNSIVLNGSTAWGFSNLSMASGNWTASVWYKPTGAPVGTSTKYLFGQQDAGNGRINIMMTYDWSWTGTFLRAGYWTPNNGGFFSSNIPLTTNSWTHILATYDGSSLKTYVNNSLLNSVPTTTASIDGGGAYMIGGYYQSSANYVVGEIGEVRVMSRVLNATEITNMYMENFPIIVGPPTAPVNLTGSIITESAFTVSWSGGHGADSYTYTINGVATTPTINNGLTSKSAAFTGLSPITAYTVVVTATNIVGSTSSSSTSVTTIRDLSLKTDLRLWLDGNDAYSMTRTATNTVTAWRDKSTNAVLPTISGSATGLTYSGTNAVVWSGSYLTMPNGTLPNGNSSFIYFFVVRSPNQNNTRLVNIGTSNSFGTQLGLHYRGSDMNFFQPDLTTTVPPANQINIITISYNGTTRVRTIALNGATGSTDTLGSVLNLPTTSQIIGANASAGEVFSGNFYDVLVYSTALSTAQRQDVEGYLAWKWGFQTTLPANHPYRNSAPA